MEEEEKRELTIKQRKWLKEYLECGNATEAAMRVYDCKDRDSAANVGYENVRKLDFEEFLEMAGLTDELIVKSLKEGLTHGDVTTDEEGRVIDTRDYKTRHKYLETIMKAKRRLIDRKDITSAGDKLIPGAKELADSVQELLNAGRTAKDSDPENS